MRVNKYWMPIISIVTLLGAVFIAKAVGAWQTSGRDMIDPTQPLSSADIRGWMPLEYLMEQLDLSQDQLYDLLGLPSSTPTSTPLKDLEDVIEVSEVRAILAEYLGEMLPDHEQDEHEAAPTHEPVPTETPVPASPDEHVPGQGQGEGLGTGTGPTPLPPGQVLPAAEIKGRMTLREVSDQCAVPLADLYEALVLSEDISPDVVLRDLHEQVDGFEVSAVRDAVADLQAR
jgi:hypothetical protein